MTQYFITGGHVWLLQLMRSSLIWKLGVRNILNGNFKLAVECFVKSAPICTTFLTAMPNRLSSPTLVSKKQDFDLSSRLQEQIDHRVQVNELVGSILSDLIEGLEVDKVRPARRRNYRSRHGEESEEEVVMVPTREDGELTSSEDDKLAAGTGIHCKPSVKSFAVACSPLRVAKGSWPVRAALATLQKWRDSKACR